MSTPINRRRALLKLKAEHDLTYAGIAELAGEGTSIKTVEGWLASPGAASYRPLPAWRMELIELRLQKQIQQGLIPKKKPKEGK